MPPLQREAILQERKESEAHDQRKASHYAKLGSTFTRFSFNSNNPSPNRSPVRTIQSSNKLPPDGS